MDELKAILEQLGATLAEVQAAIGGTAEQNVEGGVAAADDPNDTAEPKGEGEAAPDEKDKIMEAVNVLTKSLAPLMAKKADGTNGAASAESRIDDGTEVTDKNKAILKALQGITARLQKACDTPKKEESTSEIAKALTDALKPIVDSQKRTDEVLKSMLEAQGITESVLESVAKSDEQAPVQTTDTTALANLFKDVLQSVAGNNGNQNVFKSNDERYDTVMKNEDSKKTALYAMAGLNPKNPREKLQNTGAIR